MSSAKAIVAGWVINVGGWIVATVATGVVGQAGMAIHKAEYLFIGGVLASSVLSGFAAARAARRNALVHATLAGLPSLLLDLLLEVVFDGSAWTGSAVGFLMPPLFVLCPIGGGYLARVVHVKSSLDSRARRRGSMSALLGPFTYAAMALWGVGEAIDSIPRFVDLFGLAFMVYASAMWTVALVAAVIGSIALISSGPSVHRQRSIAWYGLLVFVGVSTYVGHTPGLIAEMSAGILPVAWLVRTIRNARVPARSNA